MLNIRKIFYDVIAVAALIVIMSVSVFAKVEDSPVAYMPNLPVWDGTVAESYAGGDGTKGNPYLISDGSQLALLMKDINDTVLESKQNTAGKYYKLTNDILLNDVSDFYNWDAAENAPENAWTPGGTVVDYIAKGFAGYFDGNNYEVIGLYVNGKDQYNGLFGYVFNGQIKNLGIKYSYVCGGNSTAALAGYIRASSANVYISGCTVDNTQVYGKDNVGAFGGYVESYTKKIFFDKCATTDTVIEAENYVGGIAGLAAAYNVTFNTTTKTNYAIEFTNCLNNGTVKGESSVGGIMGSSKDMITPLSGSAKIAMLFENCINNGYILCKGTDVGGIAGFVGPEVKGERVLTNIINCYVNQTSSDRIYGISFSLTDITNSKVYTPDQMSDNSNFRDYDFDSIWVSVSGSASPSIRVRGDALGDGKLTAQDIIETLGVPIGAKDISEFELFNIDFHEDNEYTLRDVNKFMDYLRNKGASNAVSK